MSKKPITLITGAGKRIGAAIARHLAAAGHDLVLHYHQSQTQAEALAQELEKMGAKVMLLHADLADIPGNFWKGLPPIDTIIHNASIYKRDRLENFSADHLREHLSVNFEAPLLLTQGFMKQLRGNGHVIVLGDGAMGWSVSPEFFTYAVSKHAWTSVIDLLAAACAPKARANVIALAPTLPGETDSDALFARLAERAPLKRTGTVEEVCAAIDFILASPGVTGQVISLANGMGLESIRP